MNCPSCGAEGSVHFKWCATNHETSGGVKLTEPLIERLVEEAERGYDVARLSPRPPQSAARLHEAMEYLAGHDTDYARVRNDIGFSGNDSHFGHVLAEVPIERWSPKMYAVAWKMAVKYMPNQLHSAGFDSSQWPTPDVYAETRLQTVGGEKSISVDGQKFVLKWPRRDKDFEGILSSVRALPQRRYDPEQRHWLAMLDAENARGVMAMAQKYGIQMTDQAADAATSVIDKADDLAKASTTAESGPIEDIQIRLGLEPHPFQWAGIRFWLKAIAPHKGVVLGDKMGLGKTPEALGILEGLDVEGKDPFPALVVCPNNAKLKWPAEIHKWVPHRTVGVLGRYGDDNFDADYIVVNYESLRYYMPKLEDRIARRNELKGKRDAAIYRYGDLTTLNIRTLIRDESHKTANTRTLQTRHCRKLAKQATWLLDLTGTSIVNAAEDFIAPLDSLGRLEELGGYAKFKWRYCYGENHHSELNQKIRSRFYRRMEQEDQHLGNGTVIPGVQRELPPVQNVAEPATLSNEDIYRKADDDFLGWLETVDVEAAHAAERAEAINRITGLKHLAGVGKIEWTVEFANDFVENDEKLVLYAHHQDVQHGLLEGLKQHNPARLLEGYVGSPKGVAEMERFQTDPKCRLIVCSLKAATEAVELTAAKHVAFVELSWTAKDHDQGVGRLYGRMNDPHGAVAHYILARGSIDEWSAELIDRKRRIATAIQSGQKVDDQQLVTKMLLELKARR